MSANNLRLTLFSILFAFLLAEVLLRWIFPTPDYGYGYTSPQSRFFQYDPQVGWIGRPDVSGQLAMSDFVSHVSHDELGFRNSYPHFVDGKENSLVVGDSHSWGWGVNNEEMFSSLLSEPDTRFNLYNLGAPGYGTDQQFLVLESFLKEFGDLGYKKGIVLFYQNDFLEILSDKSYSYAKSRFRINGDSLELENVPVPKSSGSFSTKKKEQKKKEGYSILMKSHLYNLLRYAYRVTVKGKRHWTKKGYPDPAPESMEYASRILQMTEELLDAYNIQLHVVFLITNKTSEKYADHILELGAHLNRLHIPNSTFKSKFIPSTDNWRSNHYNPYGHQLLTRHIEQILESK